MQPQRILTGLTALIALILTGFVLKAAQAVILPLVIAWFLSYILAPLVNLLARRKVPTAPAIAAVLALLFVVFYLAGLFVYSRAIAFIAEYPKYAAQLTQITHALSERLTVPAWIPLDSIDWPQQIGRRLVAFSGSFLAFTGNLAMVLVFLIFMLLGKPYFAAKVQRAFTDGKGAKIAAATETIARQISRYLYLKLILSAVSSALVWLVLVIGRSDFPLTWAVLAFLLSFIPSIGIVVASIPPILLAVVQFYPAVWPAAAIAASLLVVHQVIGGLLEPKVMGDHLNLSPMFILCSLVFWGWLWGIAGALLAVPIAVVIRIVCEQVDALRPAGVLMGSGKPPAKPSEPRRKP